MLDITSEIMKYESGELGTWEVILLFAELIKTGKAYQLQGSYGRSANALIESGYITSEGDVTDRAREEIYDESED